MKKILAIPSDFPENKGFCRQITVNPQPINSIHRRLTPKAKVGRIIP
jgi:hypothetical protein